MFLLPAARGALKSCGHRHGRRGREIVMPGRRDCFVTGRGRIQHRSEHHDLRPRVTCCGVVRLGTAPQPTGAAAAPAACRRRARPARPRQPATPSRPSNPSCLRHWGHPARPPCARRRTPGTARRRVARRPPSRARPARAGPSRAGRGTSSARAVRTPPTSISRYPQPIQSGELRTVTPPWSATCTAATASASTRRRAAPRPPVRRPRPRLPRPGPAGLPSSAAPFRSFAPGTVRRRPPSLDYGRVSRGVQRQDCNRM